MIPLGARFLDCMLVHDPKCETGGGPPLPDGVDDALDRYRDLVPDCASPIWFDRAEGICFSASQFRGSPFGKDYNFLAPPEGFPSCPWGERFVAGSIGMNPLLSDQPQRFDSEIVCGAIPRLAEVTGKRLLIVLGGPSTARTNWWRFDHDLSWTCNNFYLNVDAARLDHQLVALAPDVPLLDNARLDRWLDRHDALIAFELERGGPVGSWREINAFCRENPARNYAYFHLRYQSALGLGSRLLLLAILMGAREIGFVGLDGVSEDGPLHAFERYKGNPQWVSRWGLGLQRRQYVIFWEYVLQLRERADFRLYNLGEACGRNLSREITGKFFPLPPKLARRLEGS